MRPIRFRAWNNETKEMLYPRYVYHFPIGYENKLELMQFTGFSDRHEIAIYEEDILTDNSSGDPEECCMHRIVWCEEEGRFIFLTFAGDGEWQPYLMDIEMSDLSGFTIIGNKFEDKSLMEQK